VPEVDPSARAALARRPRIFPLLFSAWVASLAGCSHAAPCRGTAWCAGGAVCGLTGACVPRPSVEETRFVHVRELAPRDARIEGAVTDADRWSLGGDGGAVLELAFGPLPEGEVRRAILRIFPYPGAGVFDGEAIVEVLRGRHHVAVRHSAGTSSPLLVDVTDLLRGASADEVATLSVRARSEVPFVAASDRIADPTIRPTLTLVQR
jgi:hypothetical protein